MVRRFITRSDGVTAIEFALVALPFFTIMLTTLQSALVYFAQQQLDNITAQISRSVLVNQASSLTQTQFAANVCAIPGATILFSCSNLMINVQNYGTGTSFSSATTAAPTLTFNTQGQVTNSFQFSPGSAGDIVVVQVMYLWPLFFFKQFSCPPASLENNSCLLIGTAVFRNEP